MKGSDYLKEHRELIGLLGNTSKALRNEALTQTKELTKELMKNPTRKNALALAKRGSSNLGKRMTTRGNRLVLRKGNVMGNGLFDLDYTFSDERRKEAEADIRRLQRGEGLFDVLSGKTTLDFGKLMEKGSADLRKLQTGKGFDDVISHYRKVQDAKEAEKAKEYAERKSRIENADANYRAMVEKYGLKGNVGNGIFGDLVEDALIEGGKKLYKFDKEHGSHLKEGVKSGFKNMVSNFFTGGRGIESATRFGRGKGGGRDRPPPIMNEHRRMILEGRGFYPDMSYLDVMPEMVYPAVLPDVMEGNGLLDKLSKDKRFSSLPNDDVSGWIEKERRSTGYYDRPAILGEGM